MEADDRSKGDGFQTQNRKGFVAVQIRKDELLAQGITIDGRNEWFCRFCAPVIARVQQ